MQGSQRRGEGGASGYAPTRPTYAQDWPAYNAAQVCEKERFMELLSELCSGVAQPPQVNGRPRLPLCDMAFAAAFKVYTRFSSRRFSSDLREALERGLITRAPHFNSVTNYMADPALTPVLCELIEASALPLKAIETNFAVDSSGFGTCRFQQWYSHKYGKPEQMRSRQWIKAHIMVGVRTNIVTAVEITAARAADVRYFHPLVESTAERFQVAEVSADKAYLSHKNLALVEQVGGVPFVPFKKDTALPPVWPETAWSRMYHMFAYSREEFLSRYHKRSNVESTFAMIKAKFGDSVLSKSEVGQRNEVLCKILAHNIVVVVGAMHEFGIEPSWPVPHVPAS
jgi:transposase